MKLYTFTQDCINEDELRDSLPEGVTTYIHSTLFPSFRVARERMMDHADSEIADWNRDLADEEHLLPIDRKNTKDEIVNEDMGWRYAVIEFEVQS